MSDGLLMHYHQGRKPPPDSVVSVYTNRNYQKLQGDIGYKFEHGAKPPKHQKSGSEMARRLIGYWIALQRW